MDHCEKTERSVREKYRELTLLLIRKKLSITTMESCTSGLIASLITDTEGASAVLRGAYVTYSNEAKIMAGVPEETIRKYSVYSAETAEAMALSCREAFHASIGIGITGTFGNIDPENREASEPGEVWFSIAHPQGVRTRHFSLPILESRYHYKLAAADAVADELAKILAK